MSESSSSVSAAYQLAALIVDQYIKARNRDVLPDEDTEKALSMKGPAGQDLYGAFKTLYLHGRFSRTMIEQALVTSPTSYEVYIQLYLRSLPPRQRSRYAADLYNSNFRGIQWDRPLYQNIHKMIQKDHLQQQQSSSTAAGDDDTWPAVLLPVPPPPEPLGDHRHEPRRAFVARIASDFQNLFAHQQLMRGAISADDIHAPLEQEEDDDDVEDDDILAQFGTLLGIQTDQIVWGQRSDTGRPLQAGEILLRACHALYLVERLCLTEWEFALMQGPSAMRQLLSRGCHLALHLVPPDPKFTGILRQAASLDLETMKFASIDDLFMASSSVGGGGVSVDYKKELLECDYCGDPMDKAKNCSGCHIAMYCQRDCQKGDWKRHKPLCQQYFNLPD